ncbi:MAG: response regulator transcription factor [Limnobacter sp.]|nr:response regulator transcription factor [Limnobacter sp.]
MAAVPEVTHTPIRVCIIDDDEKIRSALKEAFENCPELSLVGCATTVAEGFELLERTQPDIALIDLGLGPESGLTLIAHIHQHMPHCESLVFTVFGDEAHVITSIEAGATGYITKDTHISEIIKRLELMRQGGSPISPIIARQLLNRFRQNPMPGPQTGADKTQDSGLLSDREKEVLEMVSRGFMQSEIAEMMGVSTNTISTYVKRMYKKLAVNSRIGAINKARELGLISQQNKPQ